MQTVNAWLSHPEQDHGFARANEVFNRAVGLGQVRRPAYRHLLVIDRAGRDHRAALAGLIAPEPGPEDAVRAARSVVAVGPEPPPVPGERRADAATADEIPEVAVAIPSCNGRALLESCLDALDASDYPKDRLEILVYDNGSSDGTVEWLAAARAHVRVLSADRNEGFAAPCNRLARAASARAVCFLNNDVRVEPGFLEALTRARVRTGAACIGARILSADARRIEFDGGSMSFLGHGAPLRGGAVASDHARDEKPFETLFASGAAMLVDREAFLAAGGFDEEYFAYFEDVDLGWRLWTLGERCVVAPAARARHREHASEELLPAGRRLALLERNALLSAVKNYEEVRAGRVLRCALALLAERARLAPDPLRRRACREALLAATAALPAAERRAADLRARRARGDGEIAPLFVDPWRPVVGGVPYARRQTELAELFGAADLFDPAPPLPDADRKRRCA